MQSTEEEISVGVNTECLGIRQREGVSRLPPIVSCSGVVGEGMVPREQ